MKYKKIIKNSYSLEFSSLARKKNLNNENIISFGLGEAYFSPPKKLISFINKAINDGYNRYSHPNGNLDLRKKLAKKYLSKPKNFIITAGAKPAMSLILSSLINKNDEVIYFDPSYPSYKSQIKIAEIESKIIRLDLNNDFKISLNLLVKKINHKTKAIIINSPHNPTGYVISTKDLSKIVKLSNKFKFYIIIDAVYDDLNYSSENYEKILKHENVIYISSFSKTLGITGWRIGYLHSANENILSICSFLQTHINTNTSTYLQKAISDYFDLGVEFTNKFKGVLQNRIEYMKKEFSGYNFKIIYPDGGFFIFINISNLNISSDKFAYNLLKEKNIAVTPGIVFGKKWDKYVRVCFAVSQRDFIAGINGLKEFIDEV